MEVPLITAAATIGGLLLCGDPAGIRRIIISVIVFAVEAMTSRWSSTHVRQERIEAIDPSLANSNSTSAVILEMMIIRIQATLFHRGPCPIFGSRIAVARVAVTQPMGRAIFGTGLNLTTTARRRGAEFEL